MSVKFVDSSLLALALTAAVSAGITSWWTRRLEEQKVLKEKKEIYDRELLIKSKTLEARKLTGEPAGTVVEDLTVDKVFLWEVEDLKKRFTSSKVDNEMKNIPSANSNPYFFPTLKGADKKLEDAKSNKHVKPTAYNKLITNHECIIGDIVRKPNMQTYTHAYVRAGPRAKLHFDPKTVNAAIITCGGLCPGLNNVIREIVCTLCQAYGTNGTVYGLTGGYRGFYDPAYRPIELTPELVQNIHHEGGTVLGSSRGGFDLEKTLDFLETKKISQLFVIGGDGTHRGAFRIHEGCMERGMNVAVAGIPKTIDNDVDYIDHSFGFSSAVEAAQVAIRAAKTEAICNMPNGVGIVKLMGRSAGYIAVHATMSSGDVDLCLVPEVPTVLEGELGCLPHLRRRVKEQGYAVVVVAEGAGEDVLGVSAETDASGNKKLPPIGQFMKTQVEEYFKKHDDVATVK
ncbi:MAG: hypothetical protein SGBAC_011960 [Bacillariaceae sp.]